MQINKQIDKELVYSVRQTESHADTRVACMIYCSHDKKATVNTEPELANKLKCDVT